MLAGISKKSRRNLCCVPGLNQSCTVKAGPIWSSTGSRGEGCVYRFPSEKGHFKPFLMSLTSFPDHDIAQGPRGDGDTPRPFSDTWIARLLIPESAGAPGQTSHIDPPLSLPGADHFRNRRMKPNEMSRHGTMCFMPWRWNGKQKAYLCYGSRTKF
jgi:hypothetical protein